MAPRADTDGLWDSSPGHIVGRWVNQPFIALGGYDDSTCFPRFIAIVYWGVMFFVCLVYKQFCLVKKWESLKRSLQWWNTKETGLKTERSRSSFFQIFNEKKTGQ